MPNSSSGQKINKIVAHVLKKLIINDGARDEDRTPALRAALDSVVACPVPFTQVSDLKQLKGFESAALRAEISQEVQAWCLRHDRPLDHVRPEQTASEDVTVQGKRSIPAQQIDPTAVLRTRQATLDDNGNVSNQPRAAQSKGKLYVPQHRTGTHGILVALYAMTPTRPPSDGGDAALASEAQMQSGKVAQDKGYYFSKANVIQIAQPFSDAKYVPKKVPSFASAQSVHSFNSAWSGMKTMINRGYVYRIGNPARFGLSALGWDVAKTCAARETNITPGCRLGGSSVDISSETSTDVGTASHKRQRRDEDARSLLEEAIEMLRADATYSAVARAALPKFSRYYELVYGSDE